jgi:TetR/AcrR family transcriptional regulator, cholesterol catabolism regulator
MGADRMERKKWEEHKGGLMANGNGKRAITSQRTKERIIRTTTQLLLKKGSSSATSTTDICSAAKLTRPSLYHYFGSKRNLLFSVHVDHIEKTLKPYLAQAHAIKDPRERLRFMVLTFLGEIICKHPELRVLIHDSLTMKDSYFQEVRGVWKEHYALLRDTIDQLRSEGDRDGKVGSSRAALFVLGMLVWVLFWFDYGRMDDIDRLAEEALAFALRGLDLGNPRAPEVLQ